MSGWQIGLIATVGAFLALYSLLLGARYGRRAACAVWAAWALPGLGHWILGRRRKAWIFLALLAATYVVGLALCSWHTVAWDDSPFFYLARYGSASTWIVGEVLEYPRAHMPEGISASWFDAGILYVAVPGLLNFVLVVNLLHALRARHAGP